MDKYENTGVVGEGSYGVVMKCRHRETGQMVAIKKFLETDEDPTVKKIAMREIRMLKRLRHENLINLIEVFRKRRKLYLVFEYVDHTVLEELEDHPKGLPPDTARSHVFQVLRGIEFCHQNNIIHRDVKPENVLVSKLGVVKLCDFGFARLMAAPGEVYTDYVATRWYRAPELLIGDTQYGREVDIWAIGCLYAETLTGDPLFPGESDIDQLFQITKLMGPLASKHRQMISKNPMFNGLSAPNQSQKSLKSLFPSLSQESLSFLKICLNLEPSARSTCTELLRSSLFTHDSFHITYPNQLRAKIQHEFGNQPVGTHKRISANKAKVENESRKLSQERRRLNSELSDLNPELVSTPTNMTTITTVAPPGGTTRNLSISNIYGSNSKSQVPAPVAQVPVPANNEDLGGQSRGKIVAPPASLTSDMQDRKASAECELQILSPIRQVHAVSPDESSMASPVRLKRYEGFEHGLNVMGRSRGGPYRNKSPPVKKTKRKETIDFGPPSTPNEKNNDRYVFLEKAFDKAFQLEDNADPNASGGGGGGNGEEMTESGQNITTTLIEQSTSSTNTKKTFANRSNTVLTAIEPLSLPSVVGSKALFGNSNNPEHSGGAAKPQGQKIGRSRTPKKNGGNSFLHPDENIHINTSRPPSHNLPYV